MSQFPHPDDKNAIETLRGSLMLLAFGVGVLAFLVAIDRPEWFNLRPASSSAAAMAQASNIAHGKHKDAK